MSYTKEIATQNRAMVQRARELLDHSDVDTVAGQRTEVIDQMTIEFPGVSEGRIISKIAKVIRQLRHDRTGQGNHDKKKSGLPRLRA